MVLAINAPGHVNNVVDRINATDKRYLKKQMELIGKLASSDTSKIGILPTDSKDILIKFAYQSIHSINKNKI